MHFHTDFLRIPQFQLLSLSRWLAETGDSRWVIAVTSCPIPPLQHHDVRRHFYTDCGTPQKNSHILTSIRAQNRQNKKGIQVYFNIQSLDEACCLGRGLLSVRFAPTFAEISVQVHSGSPFTHRSLEGRPFRSLAQESVRVMAKHSSASRHW